MNAVLDTLAYSKRLRAAGFTEEQAEVQTEILKDLAEGNLATKLDIATVNREIEKLRDEVKRDIEVLRAEVKRDIEVLRAEVKRDLAEAKADVIKWMIGLLFLQAGFIVALVKLI
jgi:uncharacterized protein YdhG (YjbR/CyaY superfamily)